MSYLLDKKTKRKKLLSLAIGVVVFIILIYFRAGIFAGFGSVSQVIFRPVLVAGQGVGGKFGELAAYFLSKSSLSQQNQNLQTKLNEDAAQMSNYNSMLADNASLKEILNRKDAKATMTLAAILAKPNQSIYDTLVIDAGAKQGLKTGETVWALGDVPIGYVGLVYDDSSKVILFSNPGEKRQVVVPGRDIFLEIVGRGGGNFEMVLPRDLVLQKGDQLVTPGLSPRVLAIVQTIISDPRDPYAKALLMSPVNIEELKFVEVEAK